jgi:hypothetical protein
MDASPRERRSLSSIALLVCDCLKETRLPAYSMSERIIALLQAKNQKEVARELGPRMNADERGSGGKRDN